MQRCSSRCVLRSGGQVWLDQMRLTRYEKELANFGGIDPVIRSVLAGSGRAVRLERTESVTSGRAVETVAAGVLAPLVFLFVWWVLVDARSRGIRRLYFLARDGQILKRVADVQIAAWGLDIEARYLYCSRESLLPPSFQSFGEFERYWIPWGYLSSISLGEICCRLNLQPADFAGALKLRHCSALADCPDRPLTPNERESVLDCLQDPALQALTVERNEGLYSTAVGYLGQEGLLDGVDSAVVDTGWKGTSQYALGLLLDRAGVGLGKTLSGYYLGLNEGAFRYADNRLYPFLFDWSKSLRDYTLNNFLCFEMLFSADHGRTVCYEQVAGRFLPIIEKAGTGDTLGMVALQHEMVCRFALNVCRLTDAGDFPERAPSLCRKLMRMFICDPSRNEADFFGSVEMASEIREKDRQPMAPLFSYAQLCAMAVGRCRVRGFWPQASFVRSDMKLANAVYGLFLRSKLLEWYRRLILRY